MNSRNPYAPPSAVVADVEPPEERLARPRVVLVALILLWSALALALPLLVRSVLKEADYGATIFTQFLMWLFSLTLLGILGWLVLSMGRARNWARIAFIAVTALKAYTVMPLVLVQMRAWQLLEVLTMLMELFACVLVFLPAANSWFRTRGRPPADPAT
jgi:hypothetical protein